MSSKKWKREIGPLQLVSHVAQIRGKQVMHCWDKRNQALKLFKMIISFACLPQVCPWLFHLLSSMAVMYHVNDQQ